VGTTNGECQEKEEIFGEKLVGEKHRGNITTSRSENLYIDTSFSQGPM
jgi:hypothetical protein